MTTADTNYDRRFLWKQYTKPPAATGKATWPDAGRLWGRVKDLSSARQTAYGAQYGRVGAEIRLNNWPAVSERDRLVDIRTGDVYELDGPPQKMGGAGEPMELVCTCHRGKDIQG